MIPLWSRLALAMQGNGEVRLLFPFIEAALIINNSMNCPFHGPYSCCVVVFSGVSPVSMFPSLSHSLAHRSRRRTSVLTTGQEFTPPHPPRWLSAWVYSGTISQEILDVFHVCIYNRCTVCVLFTCALLLQVVSISMYIYTHTIYTYVHVDLY